MGHLLRDIMSMDPPVAKSARGTKLTNGFGLHIEQPDGTSPLELQVGNCLPAAISIKGHTSLAQLLDRQVQCQVQQPIYWPPANRKASPRRSFGDLRRTALEWRGAQAVPSANSIVEPKTLAAPLSFANYD